MPLLSVVVPVYNESKTIRQILEKINSIDIDKEIIVVDDGSCDGTDKILREIRFSNFTVIHHTRNRGKGAAFLTGLAHSKGEFVIIQDADLEYDPNDYFKMIETIKKTNADIVLGVRFVKGYNGLFLHRIGNRVLSALFNLLFHTKLNDCFTCYKFMRRSRLNSLDLKAQRFELEVEIIARAVIKKMRIVEIPIAYHPRSYCEGKKIRFNDAFAAILTMIRFRFA